MKNYKEIDINNYYRKGVFEHFTKDCKCSTSITSKIVVDELVEFSKNTDTKFYINFLYCLAKVINSRDDYKSAFLWQENKVIVYDKMNITHYIFHEDTETCTPVYTKFDENYEKFYKNCENDIKKAKETREYMLDEKNHQNYFDAS